MYRQRLCSVLFVAGCLVMAACADAASVNVTQTPTASGFAYSISIDGSGVGEFNTIDVRILPCQCEFLNFDADGLSGTTVRNAGEDFTFTNALLYAPPVFGGHGLIISGHEDDGPNGISYSVDTLGPFIDASREIFLNNVVLPPGKGGILTISLLNTGQEVFRESSFHPSCVPEASSCVLCAIGMGFIVLRRRNG